jgi:GxxExxY protein
MAFGDGARPRAAKSQGGDMPMRLTDSLSDDEEMVATQTIECALAVHRALGPGYLESLYRRAMCIELEARALSFSTEVPVDVSYRGRVIGTHRVDLVVQGLVVVELKAIESLDPVHRRQVVSYLRATRLRLGLLINFNVELLKRGLQRVILSRPA